jgi:hypothetical protein
MHIYVTLALRERARSADEWRRVVVQTRTLAEMSLGAGADVAGGAGT